MSPIRALAGTVAGAVLSCTAPAMTAESDNPLRDWSREQWSAAESRLHRFQLFTGCQPGGLAVVYLSRPPNGIALSEAALRDAVERRLRAARLHVDVAELRWRLAVRVSVFGPAFAVRAEFAKWAHDPLSSNDWGPAGTWQASILGMHGDNTDFVQAEVQRVVGDFIDAYQRVNESACSAGAPP